MQPAAAPPAGAELLRPTPAGHKRVRELHDRLAEGSFRCAELAHLARYVGLSAAPALDRAVRRFVRTHAGGGTTFLQTVLEPAARCALEFDELFSFRRSAAETRTWVEVNMPQVCLSRRQLLCVVANAFFNTFAHREQRSQACMPTIEYRDMQAAADGRNSVEIVKLRLLFDYFAGAGALPLAEALRRDVEVCRSSLPACGGHLLSAANLATRMAPPTVHALGESIDEQHAMLRMDFANRWIGGGALSDGSVQEEITFAQCPELTALRWLHGPMEDTESIVVRGYGQYGAVRSGSYGYQLRYGGPLPHVRRMGGALLAVDAMDYRFASPALQYEPAYVMRELVKLLSALTAGAAGCSTNVAGGNWGCGVFRGDLELKLLIQWLACGLCGKTLHYFPFNEPVIGQYGTVLQGLCRDGLTASQLFAFLMQLGPSGFGADGSGSVMMELLLYVAGRASAAGEEESGAQ